MHKLSRPFGCLKISLALAAATLLLAGAPVAAQCPPEVLVPSLRVPLGITQSNQNNLLVSEAGTAAPNTGRISIVDPGSGSRQTLLDGLPSGINDVGEPSGPAGLDMRGRTLYVAIGVGDSLLPGPVPNPNLSSPLFSSVLAVHFSASVEKSATGFTLTPAHHQALADGQKVTLANGAAKLTLELIADFPNSTPDPTSPSGFRNTNPFDLIVVADRVYVTDGGQNLIWQVDLATDAVSVLTTFPRLANPLFNPMPPPPSLGGPFVDPVPTGITYSGGQLLVTLLTGFPFAPGLSVVEQVDPLTGEHAPFISGLRTAIDVRPVREDGDTDYLVLQHNSGAVILPPWSGPGLLLRFEEPGDAPAVIADCLTRPTSMTLDEKTGTLYVTELTPGFPLLAGRLVAVSLE